MTTRPRLAPPLEENGKLVEAPPVPYNEFEAYEAEQIAALKAEQQMLTATVEILARQASQQADRLQDIERLMLRLQDTLMQRLTEGLPKVASRARKGKPDA